MTLEEAVRAGDLTSLQQALAESKDANPVGEEGRTPLIEAAARGRADMVALLLDAGAEPSWKDSMGETALLKAAAHGHQAVVHLLWPEANSEEQETARAFLRSFRATQAEELPASPDPDDREEPGVLRRKAVTVAARAAHFFGEETPLKRVERQTRALERKKK